MKRHYLPARRSAFTLIEMVLAIGVMAMVMLVINSVFFTALRLRDRTADAVDQAQPVQQAMTFLRRDLVGVMAPNGPLSGDFKAGNVSEQNMAGNAAVEMYTTTGVLREDQPWGDVQKVTYELKDAAVPGGPGGKDLIRSVTRNLLNTVSPEVDDQWMMSGVQDIKFECFDGLQWNDTWDTTSGNTNLPVAVRVRIELAGAGSRGSQEPMEIVVPIDSQSPTNQIQPVANTGI
jgi:general secretion pathway protein J